MPTTVHLASDLLDAVDHRARDLGLSRNRYIIRALERALAEETRWSPRFVEELEAARSDGKGKELIDEMRAAIARGRTRKAPPNL